MIVSANRAPGFRPMKNKLERNRTMQQTQRRNNQNAKNRSGSYFCFASAACDRNQDEYLSQSVTKDRTTPTLAARS